MSQSELSSDIDRHRRQITTSVLGLLFLALAIGVFALVQISKLKSGLRTLGREALVFSSSLTRLETEKFELVDAARALRRRLASPAGSTDIPISETLSGALTTFSALLQRQDVAVLALEEQIRIFSAESRVDTRVKPLERLLVRSRVDIDRFRRLVETMKANDDVASPATLNALTEVLEKAHKGLPDFSNDVGDILSVLSSRTLRQAGRLESELQIEIAVVTIVALLLGLFASYRIRVMQRALVAGQQLVALGKVAVALQHEINNPLAVIIGNSYIIRSTETSQAERDAALLAIEEAATRIAAVIQRTKDLEDLSTTEYLGGVEMIDLSRKTK